MPTKRETIIGNLKTLLENPTWALGLANVSIQVEIIPVQKLNFTEFPVAHIVDKDQLNSYLPCRIIRARINPLVRIFYRTSDFNAAETINGKLNAMFASANGFPLGSALDYFRIKAFRTIREVEHRFVELRTEMEISFRYKDE